MGRAEMLTNGYKSLRTQGLLRATKIPDDIPQNVNDVSVDEGEANQQSQTNILTNQDPTKNQVEIIDDVPNS